MATKPALLLAIVIVSTLIVGCSRFPKLMPADPIGRARAWMLYAQRELAAMQSPPNPYSPGNHVSPAAPIASENSHNWRGEGVVMATTRETVTVRFISTGKVLTASWRYFRPVP